MENNFYHPGRGGGGGLNREFTVVKKKKKHIFIEKKCKFGKRGCQNSVVMVTSMLTRLMFLVEF